MLFHERYTDQTQDGKGQQCQPNASESFHEGADNTIIPSLGEMLDLIEIVSNTVNFICGTRLVAESIPKLRFEDILVHSRPKGNSNSTTETAREV